MYNFRYHLVTIVSIFAALALGLLLGVAITGSDLVRDASSNLAKSLTDQFDELNATNRDLSDKLKNEQQFSEELATGWQKDRLDGRTIAILTRAPKGNDVLCDELSALITQSGGTPVVIHVDETKGFGLGDASLLASLKKITPEVEGEDYSMTLARGLAREWSFVHKESGSKALKAFEENYPLTRCLVDAKVIEITVSYQPLLNKSYVGGPAGSSATSTQRILYQLAEDSMLPYGVNGIIDTSVKANPDPTSSQFDSTSIFLLREFEALGQAGELSLLYAEADDSPRTSESALQQEGSVAEIDKDSSYFALMVQAPENSDIFMSMAQSQDISCVLSSQIAYRNYSIIALLTGAPKGIYGPDRSGIRPYPQFPADKGGITPFVEVPWKLPQEPQGGGSGGSGQGSSGGAAE